MTEFLKYFSIVVNSLLTPPYAIKMASSILLFCGNEKSRYHFVFLNDFFVCVYVNEGDK